MSQKKAKALRNLCLSMTIIFGVMFCLWVAIRIAYSNIHGIEDIKDLIEATIDIQKVIQIVDRFACVSFVVMYTFEILTIWINERYVVKFIK